MGGRRSRQAVGRTLERIGAGRKRCKVVGGVRKHTAFQTSYTTKDMCLEIRDGFQHLGLVPQFPAAPAPPSGGTKVPEAREADVDVSVARVWTQLNFGVGFFAIG